MSAQRMSKEIAEQVFSKAQEYEEGIPVYSRSSMISAITEAIDSERAELAEAQKAAKIFKDAAAYNESELEAAKREIERLAWNLAGCSTYALGHDIAEGHNKEMALPALDDVLRLAKENDSLHQKLREAEEALNAWIKYQQCDEKESEGGKYLWKHAGELTKQLLEKLRAR